VSTSLWEITDQANGLQILDDDSASLGTGAEERLSVADVSVGSPSAASDTIGAQFGASSADAANSHLEPGMEGASAGELEWGNSERLDDTTVSFVDVQAPVGDSAGLRHATELQQISGAVPIAAIALVNSESTRTTDSIHGASSTAELPGAPAPAILTAIGSERSDDSFPLAAATTAASPFVINVTYDASASSAPAQFKTAIASEVQYLESLISAPLTVNIQVGYGEVDGSTLGSSALGESSTVLTPVSYSSIKTALASIDSGAAANLPSSAPGSMWLSTAEAKALGLAGASGNIDGYVGFSSSANIFDYDNSNGVSTGQYDFAGVVAHEFTEVMGRIDLFNATVGGTAHSYSLLDLYHYTSTGVHTYTGATSNYFSVDGGATSLKNFNTNSGGDLGDWANSAGNDSFLAFSSSGTVNSVSQADVTEMNALGYSVGSSGGAAKPVATVAQLADYLLNGFWTYNNTIAHHWSISTISYNISGLTSAEQLLAQSALNAWHGIANLTFVQTAGSANITFNHNGSLTAYETDNYNGSGIMSSATVDISADWVTTDGGANDGKTGIDSYAYQTYIHEIGHALGLGHQGPYNGSATYSANALYADDTWQYSVMSYFSEPNYNGGSYRYVVTPQMADIYAVQSVYGAASTQPGNTVYGFHSTAGSIFDFSQYTQAPALTIYNSGGNNTLDCSGYSVAQTIDLHPGSFSSIGGLVHNIGISSTTIITTAIAGSGNDTLIASDTGCTLIAGAGADTLLGGAGSDRLVAGSGRDVLTGGSGADKFVFKTGDVTAASGQHNLITDFVSGTDVIDLSGLDANSSTLSTDTFTFLGTAALTGPVGALDYYYDSTHNVTVVQGDTSGDHVADFAIDLSGNITLSASDFLGVFEAPLATIEASGSTTLVQAGSHYYFLDSGSSPSFKFNGSDIVAGQFGAWTPIAAEHTASGYDVAWKGNGIDQYVVWATDINGNYTTGLLGPVTGSDPGLENLESTVFHQDLNGDSIIGVPGPMTVIESAGVTSLVESSNHYYFYHNGVGPSFKFNGADVVTGQFGAWAPIGAEQTSTGYDVAWQSGGQYVVWQTDSNGNYTTGIVGPVDGTNSTLQSLETTFQQDLNGDGTIGVTSSGGSTPPAGSQTVIESHGTTSLVEANNHYYFFHSGAGPSFKFNGADVVSGEFGSWSPIGAEQTSTGYDVAWQSGSQYVIWQTDSNGNYTTGIVGPVDGSNSTLQSLETTFQQDLNGDGTIGPAPAGGSAPSGGSQTVIESFGVTSLVESNNHYYFYQSGAGPSLKFSGSDVVAGQFGAWSPIGAEKTSTGYDVAWKSGTQYVVWQTDNNGNYTTGIVGPVDGANSTLQSLETTFQQDLNGDGVIGLHEQPIASQPVANQAITHPHDWLI